MPGSTARLSLYLPGGGSAGIGGSDEVADIDKLNGNFQVIDAAIGIPNATSDSRPSSPFTGQMIRETDTGDVRRWDGTKWRSATPHVGTTAPANPSTNDLWVDTSA